MLTNTQQTQNTMFWLFTILATAVAVVGVPSEVLATEPTSASEGFGAVAFQIYDALEGDLGLVISLTGIGLALAAMIKGMSAPVIASAAGVAIGAQIAPDVAVNLSGGFLLP